MSFIYIEFELESVLLNDKNISILYKYIYNLI